LIQEGSFLEEEIKQTRDATIDQPLQSFPKMPFVWKFYEVCRNL